MVMKYIATRPILDLCEQSVWRPGAWVYRRCWDKEVIELGGAREIKEAALYGEEENHGEEAAQEEMTGRS